MDRHFLETLRHEIFMPMRYVFDLKYYPNLRKALDKYALAVRKWKAKEPPRFRTVKEYKEIQGAV